MLIFDAHLDLAWNAVEWNRNLEWPVERVREFEKQFVDVIPGDMTVTFPAMRHGKVGVCIATLLPRLHRKDKQLTFYQSRESAYATACGQLAYYRAMCRKGVLRALPDAKALADHVQEWRTYIEKGHAAPTIPPIGYILSMEGAPPILSPDQAQEWYDVGLRIVGPGHYGPNEYCHGTGCEGGLTSDGRKLLKEMDRVGMLLDATHLADESFWEALDIFHGPVLASHHNCRAIAPGDRQLADDQIKALVAREAVIGAAFDNWMIVPGYIKTVTPASEVSLEHIANHIDRVCQLAGSVRHSGIGTDLDGGFGREQAPGDLDTIADVQKLHGIFQNRGYTEADIERIFWRNFVEFFERAWSETPVR